MASRSMCGPSNAPRTPSARTNELSRVPSSSRSQPSVQSAKATNSSTIATSSVHVASQPSNGIDPESSQVSGAVTVPSPQPATLEQSAAHAGEPSQTSPAATSTTPLPQLSSLRQSERQPSPDRSSPSSQTSPSSTVPSPQNASRTQPRPQPSPLASFPSSHVSPGSRTELPHTGSARPASGRTEASAPSFASPHAPPEAAITRIASTPSRFTLGRPVGRSSSASLSIVAPGSTAASGRSVPPCDRFVGRRAM